MRIFSIAGANIDKRGSRKKQTKRKGNKYIDCLKYFWISFWLIFISFLVQYYWRTGRGNLLGMVTIGRGGVYIYNYLIYYLLTCPTWPRHRSLRVIVWPCGTWRPWHPYVPLCSRADPQWRAARGRRPQQCPQWQPRRVLDDRQLGWHRYLFERAREKAMGEERRRESESARFRLVCAWGRERENGAECVWGGEGNWLVNCHSSLAKLIIIVRYSIYSI